MNSEDFTGEGLPSKFVAIRLSGAALVRTVCMSLVLFVGAAGGGVRASDIRIVGSDLLGLEFSKTLYEFAAKEGVRLALALDGSRPGVDELRAGRADLALLTLPASEELAEAAFESAPLGYHRVVVLVPETCPLERVTFEQLVGIFAASGAAPVERWGDLGIAGEWSNYSLVALVPEPGTGIVAEYFRHVVLRGRPLKSNIERYPDFAAVARRSTSTARVVAIGSQLPVEGADLKALAVAADGATPAQWPTAEALHRGTYPLRLPLRLVVRRDVDPRLRPVIRFLFSDVVAERLTSVGIVPVPAEARGQTLAALEKM